MIIDFIDKFNQAIDNIWPVTGQGFQNTDDRQSYILRKFHKSKKSS